MRARASTRLRVLLGEGRTLIKPGAFNALSAMVIEKAGFACCGVSGYAVSASLLGKPDVGLLTLDEIVMITRYIARAVSIPVIADADTGFGNAINAMRTVKTSSAAMRRDPRRDQAHPRLRTCPPASSGARKRWSEAARLAHVRPRARTDFVLIARCERARRRRRQRRRTDRPPMPTSTLRGHIFPEARPLRRTGALRPRDPGALHFNRTASRHDCRCAAWTNWVSRWCPMPPARCAARPRRWSTT